MTRFQYYVSKTPNRLLQINSCLLPECDWRDEDKKEEKTTTQGLMRHLYPLSIAYLPQVSITAWGKSDLRYISYVIFYKVGGGKRVSMKKKKKRKITGTFHLKKKTVVKFNYTALIINY